MELLNFLQTHRHTLNLSEVSRLAGYSNSYLKHVLAGRRCFNASAQRKVKIVIVELCEDGNKAVQDV